MTGLSSKVDIMIIGAQKAGTTSLKNYLGEHPQLCSHTQKEFSYLTDEEEYSLGFSTSLKKYFPNIKNIQNKRLVCKNAGLYTRIKAIEKLHENNPLCELVLLLRNPVDRAYSSYLMEKNAGAADFEFKDLPDIIRDKSKNSDDWKYGVLVDYGKYILHIENILRVFPRNQLSVFLYEDFEKHPENICSSVFEKVNVRPGYKPDFSKRYNVTVKHKSIAYAKLIRSLLKNENPVKSFAKKLISGPTAYKYGEMLREVNKTEHKYGKMSNEVRDFLVGYFKPYNERLSKFINKDISHWNQ